MPGQLGQRSCSLRQGPGWRQIQTQPPTAARTTPGSYLVAQAAVILVFREPARGQAGAHPGKPLGGGETSRLGPTLHLTLLSPADPLTSTPPPSVAKPPGVLEALGQASKAGPSTASQSKPLPPQPPSRLPQKKPAPG